MSMPLLSAERRHSAYILAAAHDGDFLPVPRNGFAAVKAELEVSGSVHHIYGIPSQKLVRLTTVCKPTAFTTLHVRSDHGHIQLSTPATLRQHQARPSSQMECETDKFSLQALGHLVKHFGEDTVFLTRDDCGLSCVT